MNEFKKIMQHYINADIYIEYGCNGTGYSNILIVEDGKIRCIGSFLYSIWRDRSKDVEVPELLQRLAIKAECYRTGLRKTVPSLAYTENELTIII